MSRPSQKPNAPRSQAPDEILDPAAHPLDPNQPAPAAIEHPQPDPTEAQRQAEEVAAKGRSRVGVERVLADAAATVPSGRSPNEVVASVEHSGAPHTAAPLEQPALPEQEPATRPEHERLGAGLAYTLTPSGDATIDGAPLHPDDRAYLDALIQRELQAATDRWNASTGPTPIVGGALFDFLGYLTSLEKGVTVGAKHNATTVLDHLRTWADQRGLDLDKAQVGTWQDALPRVPRQARDAAPSEEELDDEGDSGDDEGEEPSTRNQATRARKERKS